MALEAPSDVLEDRPLVGVGEHALLERCGRGGAVGLVRRGALGFEFARAAQGPVVVGMAAMHPSRAENVFQSGLRRRRGEAGVEEVAHHVVFECVVEAHGGSLQLEQEDEGEAQLRRRVPEADYFLEDLGRFVGGGEEPRGVHELLGGAGARRGAEAKRQRSLRCAGVVRGGGEGVRRGGLRKCNTFWWRAACSL